VQVRVLYNISIDTSTDSYVFFKLGLLNSDNLPVAGIEVARKVVNPFGLPSNTLMAKWKESEGLSIDDY
jgi:hypothetical protein